MICLAPGPPFFLLFLDEDVVSCVFSRGLRINVTRVANRIEPMISSCVSVVPPILNGSAIKKRYAIGMDKPTDIPIILPLSSGEMLSAKKAPQAAGLRPARTPSASGKRNRRNNSLDLFSHTNPKVNNEANNADVQMNITLLFALSIKYPLTTLDTLIKNKNIRANLPFSMRKAISSLRKLDMIGPNIGKAISQTK